MAIVASDKEALGCPWLGDVRKETLMKERERTEEDKMTVFQTREPGLTCHGTLETKRLASESPTVYVSLSIFPGAGSIFICGSLEMTEQEYTVCVLL